MEDKNNEKKGSNNVMRILLAILVCIVIIILTILSITLYKADKVAKSILNNSTNVQEDSNNKNEDVKDIKDIVLSSDRVTVQSSIAMSLADIMQKNKEPVTVKGKIVKLIIDNKLQEVGYDLKTMVAVGNTGNEYIVDLSNCLSILEARKDVIWIIDTEGRVSTYILEPNATDENPIAKKIEN